MLFKIKRNHRHYRTNINCVFGDIPDLKLASDNLTFSYELCDEKDAINRSKIIITYHLLSRKMVAKQNKNYEKREKS